MEHQYFDKALLRKLAKFSAIYIREEEEIVYQETLTRFIEFVSVLDDIDTDGVEPMVSPLEGEAFMRDDQVTQTCSRENILANAPERFEEFFSVPKMIESSVE